MPSTFQILTRSTPASSIANSWIASVEDVIAHTADRSPEVLGNEERSDHALGDQLRAHRGRFLGAGS